MGNKPKTLIALGCTLFVLTLAACEDIPPSPYRDVMISCDTVSEQFEVRLQQLSESSGRVQCHGGEWIETSHAVSMSGGERVGSLEFDMSIQTLGSLTEAKGRISFWSSQIEEDEVGDDNFVH